MPLGRYFVFIGSMLIAALFLADNYLPPLTAATARADVDRSVIRLHSQHKWPERVVFDTSQPTIVPSPQVAQLAAEKEPAPVEAAADVRKANEALALATPVRETAPATARKPATKRRLRTARTYRAPRGGYVASYEPRGYGNPFAWNW